MDKSPDDLSDDKTQSATEVDKCPICLQKFASGKSKSYASSCSHSFCFECLLEWSKVKYSCPLCKQDFDRIVYDQISRLEYKVYFLPVRQDLNPILDVVECAAEGSNPTPPSKASWVIGREAAPLSFRMLVYQNGWYVSTYQSQTDITLVNIELDLSDEPLKGNRSPRADEKPIVNQSFDYKPDTTESLACISYQPIRKFRSVSPDWLKSNPACFHRIMQFMNRELKALAGLEQLSLANRDKERKLTHTKRFQLMNLMINRMKESEIKSGEFLAEICEHIRPIHVAKHFQHELLSFAQSIYEDLIAYDARCVYYKDKDSVLSYKESNNQILGVMNRLPINLEKYRLLKAPVIVMPTVSQRVEEYFEAFDASIQNSGQENATQIQGEPSREQRVRTNSEYSSYCEEIEPPPKPEPVLIVLSAESDEESVKPSTSAQADTKSSSRHKKSKKSKKSKKKKSNKEKSRKRSRSRSRSRHKKHKSSHKSHDHHHHKSRRRHRTRRSRSSTRSSSRSSSSRKHRSQRPRSTSSLDRLYSNYLTGYSDYSDY